MDPREERDVEQQQRCEYEPHALILCDWGPLTLRLWRPENGQAAKRQVLSALMAHIQ